MQTARTHCVVREAHSGVLPDTARVEHTMSNKQQQSCHVMSCHGMIVVVWSPWRGVGVVVGRTHSFSVGVAVPKLVSNTGLNTRKLARIYDGQVSGLKSIVDVK